ncbi:MAG TPA: Stp1/IreP family PP2C-type Ser/Thr phosphatase [Gemmatimonadaceae bacterium]|nr:Stp1/IreP family PP2C-type Ser/Thr phosphatase [Gemmatimonadaceae bacterium]
MHLAVAARTDVGRIRKGNEDSLHASANAYRGLFIVADGMGGHAAGEVASEMAVEMVSRDLSDLNDLETPDAHRRVSTALRDANRAVYERTRIERDKLGMGSTVSALLLSEHHYLVGHVGDSRIYLVREGRMQQLTRDHSLVQEQVDAGLLTPEQARRHPQSNVITRCIGMADEIQPDVFDGEAMVGDAFLLASDGLTGMVDDRRIQQLLMSRAKPERIVDALIAEANTNGGNDNITAVVVRVLAAEGTGTTDRDVTPVPPARTHG